MDTKRQHLKNIDELIHKHARPSVHRTPDKEYTRFSYTTTKEYALALIEDLEYQPGFLSAEITYNPSIEDKWQVTIIEDFGRGLTKKTISIHTSFCLAVCSAILSRKNITIPEESK